MTKRKRPHAELQKVASEGPAVPARWEAPGRIDSLSLSLHATIEPTSMADALAREEVAGARAEAEADVMADRDIFHPDGHRHTRRGGQ